MHPSNDSHAVRILPAVAQYHTMVLGHHRGISYLPPAKIGRLSSHLFRFWCNLNPSEMCHCNRRLLYSERRARGEISQSFVQQNGNGRDASPPRMNRKVPLRSLWHKKAIKRQQSSGGRAAAQCEDLHSKGVDILLIPKKTCLSPAPGERSAKLVSLSSTPLMTCTMQAKTSRQNNLQGASKMLYE